MQSESHGPRHSRCETQWADCVGQGCRKPRVAQDRLPVSATRGAVHHPGTEQRAPGPFWLQITKAALSLGREPSTAFGPWPGTHKRIQSRGMAPTKRQGGRAAGQPLESGRRGHRRPRVLLLTRAPIPQVCAACAGHLTASSLSPSPIPALLPLGARLGERPPHPQVTWPGTWARPSLPPDTGLPMPLWSLSLPAAPWPPSRGPGHCPACWFQLWPSIRPSRSSTWTHNPD